MARNQQYTLGRVFVGGRPIEDLTPEERTAFQQRTVQRMGDSLNAYFSLHPEAYLRFIQHYDATQTPTQTPGNLQEALA